VAREVRGQCQWRQSLGAAGTRGAAARAERVQLAARRKLGAWRGAGRRRRSPPQVRAAATAATGRAAATTRTSSGRRGAAAAGGRLFNIGECRA